MYKSAALVVCVALSVRNSVAREKAISPAQFRVSPCQQAAASMKEQRRQSLLCSCMVPTTETR